MDSAVPEQNACHGGTHSSREADCDTRCRADVAVLPTCYENVRRERDRDLRQRRERTLRETDSRLTLTLSLSLSLCLSSDHFARGDLIEFFIGEIAQRFLAGTSIEFEESLLVRPNLTERTFLPVFEGFVAVTHAILTAFRL